MKNKKFFTIQGIIKFKPKDRFIIIAVVMLIIWGSLWYLWYLKADEVTMNPCSICAKGMNDDVSFVVSGMEVQKDGSRVFITKGLIFHPDGTIDEKIMNYSEAVNFSMVLEE